MERSAFLRNLKAGLEMNKLKVDRSKNKNLSKEELVLLSKEELVNIVIQLQSNNIQLKNVIAKKNEDQVAETRDGKKAREFDFSRYETRRIFLRIAYLGGSYRGLAVQEDSPDTVEFHLFRALEKGCLIRARAESHYHRCGRTDKGVSASGQVISIEVRSCLSLHEQLSCDGGRRSELAYCKILNRLLPVDIRAVAWLPAPMSDVEEYFSARFDCKQRTYKYWFPRGSLDLTAMSDACVRLQGSRDFRNLCKMDVANGVTAFVRDVKSVQIVAEKAGQDDDKGYGMHYLIVRANAFLWHQIRCMAGILFLVGSGYEDPSVVSQLLDVKTNPRKPQYNMAIDLPLNLYHCAFEFLDDFEEATGLRNKKDQSLDITKNTTEDLFASSNDRIKTVKEATENKTLAIDSHFTSQKEVKDSESQKDTPCQIDGNISEELVDKSVFAVESNALAAEDSQELIEIEENAADSDQIEHEKETPESTLKNVKDKYDDSADKNNAETLLRDGGRESKLSDAEPMQHSEDENMMLSGKFELKKDWWHVDLEDLAIVIKNFQSQWAKSAIQASMIRDIIEDLETLYNKEVSRKPPNSIVEKLGLKNGRRDFLHQSDCMLQGVTPKTYQPLLKRTTCESLENRIEHYVKKKRLRMSSEES